MVLAINEAFLTVLIVTDENNNPVSGKTISYVIYDETQTQFATGSMTEIGTTGIYYKSWTPDAEGYWIFKAYYEGSDFHFYDIKLYQVGKGIEDDIYDRIGTPAYTDVAGDIANLITRTKGLNDIHDDLTAHNTALGTHDTAIKALLGTPVANIAADIANLITRTKGLDDIHDDLGALQTDIGDFSARTNLKSLLAILGWADVTGVQTLEQRLGYQTTGSIEGDLALAREYTDEIEGLLKHDVIGLNALKTEIDANETKIDALENKIKAAPSVDSILFKSSGAVCPTGKSIWNALGDGTVSLNTLNTLLTDGTYGLAALETLVDEVEDLLKNGTYGLAALDTDLNTIITRIGDPTGHTLTTLVAKFGDLGESLQAILEVFTPSESGGLGDRIGFIQQHIAKGNGTVLPSNKSLYDVIALDRLDNATYGLSALKGEIDANETKIDALENKIKASPSVDSILFKSGGAVCPASKSIWDALGDGSISLNTLNSLLTDATYGLSAIETLVDEVESLLKDGTYGLSALRTAITAVNTDLGDWSAQTNLQSLLAALGIPDVAGKPLYTCLITDRLDNATFGLSALKTEIDANETKIDALENKIKATPSVDSILFKSGGATCPASKSIWDALGDGSVSLNTLNNLLTNGTYGLSALETLVDEVESLLKDGTYGLAALDADLTTIISYVDCLPSNFSTQVQSDVDAKLTAYHLDHLIQVASTVVGTPTIDKFDTNLTEATNDHYNGHIVMFTSGVLAGQARLIIDYDGTTKEITVHPSLTDAPSATDAFVILTGSAQGALYWGSKGLQQIYDLIDQLFNLNRVGDTITTDGTEQILWIIDNPDFPFKPTKLIVDFTNNTATETVEIKLYYRIKDGGSYILNATYTYIGAQDPDLIDIDLLPNTFGVKLTIEKTAGTNRAYDYEIYFEEK